MLDLLETRVRVIQKNADANIRNIEKCCQKGCSYCCYQVIKIVSVEELPITQYLDSKVNRKTKKIIKSNIEKWFDYFDSNTPNDRNLRDSDILNIEKKLASDKIPCPFLINKLCSIYQVRPIVCRTHLVENDPERCKINTLRDPMKIAQELRVFNINELLKLGSKGYIRLLPYSLTDYFSIKRKLKPIEQLAIIN